MKGVMKRLDDILKKIAESVPNQHKDFQMNNSN